MKLHRAGRVLVTAGLMVLAGWIGRSCDSSLNGSPADAGGPAREGRLSWRAIYAWFTQSLPTHGSARETSQQVRAEPVALHRISDELVEARLALHGLLEENAAFQKEVLDLREQVRKLTDSFALEKARGDHWAAYAQRQHYTSAGTAEGEAQLNPVALLEVDRERLFAVLDAGGEDGVRLGMLFMVNGGTGAGSVMRVVDVRPRISGASIEWMETGRCPEAGDLAIPTVTGR